MRILLLMATLLLVSGCSMVAVMDEQALGKRLDAMDARLWAVEVQRVAVQ